MDKRTAQKPAPPPVEHLSVLADRDIPEMGIKAGEMLHLIYDEAIGGYQVVRWAQVQWRCTCAFPKPCEHQIHTNTWLYEQSRQAMTACEEVVEKR